MAQQQPATVAVDIKGVGRVHFPASFTPEQIESAIERDIIPQQKPARAPEPAIQPEEPTRWERFGRGAQNTVDRLAQLVVAGGEKLGAYPEGLGDVMTEQMNTERADYDKARGGPKLDAFEMLGTTGTQAPLVALPGGGQTLAAKAGLGAITGAASGLLQYDETNSLGGTARNVGTGALTGAVLNPLTQWFGGKVGEAVKYTAGKIKGLVARVGGETSEQAIVQAVPELAQLPPEVRQQLIAEARKALIETGDLPAEQLGRKANLMTNDVTPTKSMVTRNPQDWAIERNLSKLSDDLAPISSQLTDLYQGNDTALTNRLTSFSEGLPKATQEGHGMTVMRAVKDQADDAQRNVSRAYDSVHGEDIINPTPNALVERLFSADLQDIEDPAVKTVIKTVENRLKRNGIVASKPSFGPDGSYNYELTGRAMTAKQTEELRKLLNSLDTPGNAGRVKAQLIRALDASITREGGQDVYGAARAEAASRFESLDNPSAQRALNTLGELEQGKTAQNFIKSQVIDAADQDVRALLATVSKSPQALDALQAGVLQHLQSKSVNPNSGQFSGANFNKALEQIGPAKLRLVFGDDGFQKITSLARAALDATYQPPYAAVNSSNTAPALLQLSRGARMIPGVPLLVSEEVQKAAARRGYGNQLADALAARTGGQAPEVPVRARQIGEILARLGVATGPTASNEVLDGVGKRPQQKAANGQRR